MEGDHFNESLVKRAIAIYNHYLSTKPLLTKCSTSALTAAIGDIIGQLLSKQAKHNVRKTIAFAIFGFCATGPIMHNFYRYLSLYIAAKQRYAHLYKLLLERTFLAPLFLLLFFYAVPLLEGKTLSTVHQRVKQAYWNALKTNWRVMSIVQYINLGYIPVQYQSLYGNLMGLLWNVYLSLKQA